MGDEADRLNDWDDFEYLHREDEARRFDDEVQRMRDRFQDNARAEVGATIRCATCDRIIVKHHYQQKFCPPKGKRYVCKDKWHNTTNPRGMYAHLKTG